MSKTVRKVVERPSGTGILHKANQRVATVNYRLEVSGEYIVDEQTGEHIEGPRDISGTITFISGDPIELGDVLTLQLTDARLIDIFTTRDNLSGTYPIAASSGFRST